MTIKNKNANVEKERKEEEFIAEVESGERCGIKNGGHLSLKDKTVNEH